MLVVEDHSSIASFADYASFLVDVINARCWIACLIFPLCCLICRHPNSLSQGVWPSPHPQEVGQVACLRHLVLVTDT